MTVTPQIVAEYLQGSCQTLDDALEDMNALDKADDVPFLEELDSLVFRCDECGWWCETSEMSDNTEWVCEDCDGYERD